MMETNCERDKLSQCKVGGPSKPFIDQNLQLQLPHWDSRSFSPGPIYSHYVGSSPSRHPHLPINEDELYQIMTNTERSYKGWKQMQQKLKEIAEKLLKAQIKT